MSVSKPTPRTQLSFITLKCILSTAIIATLAAILGTSFASRRKTQQVVDSSSSEDGFQDNQFGLLELAPGLNPAVDIIAIHGLDGHRLHSWTAQNGVCWLRDLLGFQVSEARILTYGYDANTRGQEQLSSQSLYSHAQSFISILALERQATATEERPIIFVAHSLGGIVLKNALVHAHLATKDNLFSHKAVALSTYGIIFLGTPHQGTQSAEFASILLNIQAITRPVNDALVKHLSRNSEALEQQLSQFMSISKDFVIKFGFETYPTNIRGFRDLIVSRASAIVPGTVDAEAISINKNHVDMSKFPSAKDEDFRTISKHLSIMLKAAPHKIAQNWENHRRLYEIHSGPIKEFCSLPALPYSEGAKTFVGRQDLLDLLHAKFSEYHTVVLTGIGGIGKTRAATEYIYKHRHDYHIALWVNADTTERIRSDFVKTAQQLIDCESKVIVDKNKTNPDYRPFLHDMKLNGLVDDRGRVSTEDCDIDRVVEAVKTWLSQERSGAWLLVFDNADDLDTVPLREFFPTMVNGRGTRILITSRDQEGAGFGIGLPVPPLNESEAVRMLLHHARREFKPLDEIDHDILEVVRIVEYLPLAIEHAGAYIAARRLPFSKYLEEYMTHWKLIFGKKRKATVGDYPRTILVTWETSFGQIESNNPHAASLLLACAFLGHVALPEELARTHALLVDQDLLYSEVLDPLFAYSLARPSEDGYSFSVHPLVHVWALQRQDEKQQRTNKAQAAHLLSGTFSLPIDHTRAKQMVIPTIFIHLFVFGTHLTLDAIGHEDPSMISSLDIIGDECMHHAMFSQALHLRSLVVRWYIINHGWEHTITTISDTGNIVGLTSMPVCRRKLAESVFTMSCNLFWLAQHPATYILFNNLAASFAQASQARLGKAIGCLEHALVGLEKLAKLHYPAAECDTINSLTILYYDRTISGVISAESRRFKFPSIVSPVEVLMERQRSLDPAELMTENPYIFSIFASEDLYRQNFVDRESVQDALCSITYLGHVLVELGKEKEAEVLLRRTLKRIEELPSKAHVHTINMCVMLANILEERDRPGAGKDSKLCYIRAVTKHMNEKLS